MAPDFPGLTGKWHQDQEMALLICSGDLDKIPADGAGLSNITVGSQVVFSNALAEPGRGLEVKSLTALAEDLFLVPNTHTRDEQLPVTTDLPPMPSEGTYRHKITTTTTSQNQSQYILGMEPR